MRAPTPGLVCDDTYANDVARCLYECLHQRWGRVTVIMHWWALAWAAPKAGHTLLWDYLDPFFAFFFGGGGGGVQTAWLGCGH